MKKILLLSGAALLLTRLLTKGAGYKQFYEKMNYYQKIKVHSITLSGIMLKCDIEIHNPVSFSLTISKPLIRVFSNNTEIAHSAPDSAKVNILPKAVTKIPTIDILIPWSIDFAKIIAALGVKAVDIIKGGAGKQIGIKIKTVALMNVDGLKDITQTQEVVI